MVSSLGGAVSSTSVVCPYLARKSTHEQIYPAKQIWGQITQNLLAVHLPLQFVSCVGCNSACNLLYSLWSQSGERAAHSILSLAGQRANSNFPGQSNCMQSPTTRPSLSRHQALQTVKAAHCHTCTCIDDNSFTLNSCICSERGTCSFVLQKGPYAVLTC